MKHISSRQNPEIIAVAALGSSKERARQGMFIAEGLRICETLLKSPNPLVQVYCTQDQLSVVETLVSLKKITTVSEPVMEKISQASTSSGIVGVFRIPENPSPKQLQPGLVAANIADPGNLGTLIRTCVALNISSLVTINGADTWSPKVVQASAGTIGYIKLFRWSFEELLKNKGALKLYALVVAGGERPTTIHHKGLLMVGSEAHGIPQEWLEHCDGLLTIPMPGNAESLNAAVAGSIALYMTRME